MRSSVLLNSCLTGIEISRDLELSWLLRLWPQISHQCNFTWINAQKTNENWKITVSLTPMAHGWCLKLKNLKFVKVKAFCNETRKWRHLAVCSSAFWGWKSSVTNIQAKAHALLIGHREVHHEPYPGSEEVAKHTICGMPVRNKWLRRPRKSIDCRQRTPMQQFHLCQNCNEIRFFESTATPSSSIGSPKAINWISIWERRRWHFSPTYLGQSCQKHIQKWIWKTFAWGLIATHRTIMIVSADRTGILPRPVRSKSRLNFRQRKCIQLSSLQQLLRQWLVSTPRHPLSRANIFFRILPVTLKETAFYNVNCWKRLE